MAKIVDRAQMSVIVAPGVGTVPLGAASAGFQTFAQAGIVDGDVVSYVIEDNGGLAWEIGHGTYTEAVPPTLARTEVVASSAGGTTKINCSASAVVYIAFHADDLANIGGLPSGVAAALKIETETTGSIVLYDGDLGTPSAGDATNLTNVQVANIVGLGDSSTLDVGTTSGTVAAGDDSRIIGAAQTANNLADLASASTARTNLGLATVAATGAYSDLSGTPALATVATTGAYSDLTGKPSLATIATSGSASDLTTGTVPAARLPNPSSTTLGGVQSKVSASHYFLTQIGTDGVVSAAQPSVGDLSGLGTGVSTALGNATNAASGVVSLTAAGKYPAFDGSLITGVVASPGGTTGQVQFNNSGSLGGFTVSGDGTLNTSTGALTITKTSGTSFAASATTDTTSAANISSGTLPSGRLSGSYTGVTGVGTLTAGTWTATVIGVTYGGTGTTTQFTSGSLVFAGASGVYSQNNSKVFWDNTNYRLGIGTATPGVSFAVSGTDAVLVPVGTTAQRPTGATGYIRYNSTLASFEGYNGSAWGNIGGGAAGGSTDHVFYENDTTVTANYTITTGKNAVTAGPITINSGATVTVPSGSTWVIV
jgi:hypothetical protein